MALDTFEEIANRVQLRMPLVGPLLAREWVKYAFRKIMERRQWSWLYKQGQFIFAANVTAGLVQVTHKSDQVVGTGTGWTGVEFNRQFRQSGTSPIYTITDVDVPTLTLTLDRVYGGTSGTGLGYEIYNAYQTAPSDFLTFISVTDQEFNWRLQTHVRPEQIDAIDAQRSNAGFPWAVVDIGIYDETVTPPLPRYEVWPHVKSQRVLPFLYVKRHDDLDDAGASLPRYIRGDVLLEVALAEGALWPGPSMDKRNPYASMERFKIHEAKAERMLIDLERQDDEIVLDDVDYARYFQSQFAPYPLDAQFVQSHGF